MTVLLGDKNRFAAEVGDWDNALCRVDLWTAGKWLTCDDNMAFVRQFRRDVLDTVAWLRSGQGSPLPFDGLSPESTHRRLLRHPPVRRAAGARGAGDPLLHAEPLPGHARDPGGAAADAPVGAAAGRAKHVRVSEPEATHR